MTTKGPNAALAAWFEDFIGPTRDTTNHILYGEKYWKWGGDGTLVLPAQTSAAPGTVQAQSGAADTNYVWLAAGESFDSDLLAVAYIERVECRFKVGQLTNFALAVGLGSSISSTHLGSDALGIFLDTSSDTDVHLFSRVASSEESDSLGTITSLLSTSQFRTLRLLLGVDGANKSLVQILGQDDRTLLSELSLSTLTAVTPTVGLQITNWGGIASKTIDVDYFRVVPRRR